jgi:cell division protein FtsI (penicillin-binding protein 3)
VTEFAPGPPSPSAPARRFGAPSAAAVPRMEDVRVTAPDLARRAAMEKTRGRLVMAAGGFALLFAALVIKLADATVIQPMRPKPVAQMRKPEPPPPPGASITASLAAAPVDLGSRAARATITDRNGEILAISLPTASLFANPRELFDVDGAVRKLKSVVPRLDAEDIRRRLSEDTKQFVYLARQITPREQLQINALGIPGIDFEPTDRRRYPLGRVASQVLGGVDVDGKGVAGVERFFDQRLREEPEPLRLSLDVRVQAVVRDELSKAIADFQAIGGCGIVMDVRTGEVLAMVSLPDYDANDVGRASPEERFNRAVTGMYEPGSTFKLQTASMALDTGTVQIWNGFDATSPIRIGRFTISDFEGKHRWLYLPEILAYSSNIGAARMAEAVGAEKQRAWMERMGMLSRIGIELPEAGLPLAPASANWKEIATLTIGFGHGIAVSPLHVVDGTAAIANGGTLFRPTILALPHDAPPRQGVRVMQQSTSDTVRRLMRLVVTDGYGKTAEVPGYYVGGKTGTAEKTSGHGYKKHSNVAAFMSAFPMNAPRYAVYMMLDEPKANASTHGYATAGWVAAPAAGRVIGRIGPMLGLLPDLDNAPAINAQLAIPLQPGRPANARPQYLPPPGHVLGAPQVSGTPQVSGAPPGPGAPRPAQQPAMVPPASPRVAPPAAPSAPYLPGLAPTPPRDLRHEASLLGTAVAAR